MTARYSNFEIRIFVFSDAAPPAGFEAGLVRIRHQAYRTQVGKPSLRGLACLGFSDTTGLRVYLLSNRKYVGVDVECRMRPDLAVRQRRLEALLSRTDRVQTDFLSRWVVKEACAKALGLGLPKTLPYLSIRAIHEHDATLPRHYVLHYRERSFAAQSVELMDATLAVGYRHDYGVPRIGLWQDLSPVSRGFASSMTASPFRFSGYPPV